MARQGVPLFRSICWKSRAKSSLSFEVLEFRSGLTSSCLASASASLTFSIIVSGIYIYIIWSKPHFNNNMYFNFNFHNNARLVYSSPVGRNKTWLCLPEWLLAGPEETPSAVCHVYCPPPCRLPVVLPPPPLRPLYCCAAACAWPLRRPAHQHTPPSCYCLQAGQSAHAGRGGRAGSVCHGDEGGHRGWCCHLLHH